MRIDPVQAEQVVIDRVFNRCRRVFADVQAQQQGVFDFLVAKARFLHVGDKGLQAFVVEAKPVDQCVGLRQAEHARLGVAGLRFRRDGADFDKTETHGGQAIDATRVFVQSGGQAHAVGEAQPGQLDRVVNTARAIGPCQRRALGARQRGHGQFVGGFCVESK